ncbi:hypothetical protein [Saccharicrinis sp. 156]|uniref:hypothetical protein n=1 Tax=Saccharicrinis sp. 156 TaxID=3417574 RepID=UPI003D32BADB
MFYTIQNNQIIYNFQKSLEFISRKGREMYGNQFKLLDQDMPVIRKLFAYVIRDEENCKQHGLNLRKGLMLSGPIGAGNVYQNIM